MKKHLFSLTLILGCSVAATAQIGIGTDDPQATLDINGNLKIRTIPEVTTISNDHYILMQNANAAGDQEIIRISPDNFSSPSSATAYAAEKTGGWSLIQLGIAEPNWYKINLTGADDTRIGDPASFVDGVFTAPSSGIYQVKYGFQLSGGVDISVLGSKRLGLIRNGLEITDQKIFDAVRVAFTVLGIDIELASVPVTTSSIDTLVELNQGDTLTFAVETGGVNLNLLTQNQVSLYLYKISN